ncbi:hypothetical protein BE04_18835 [Sorangium cellulosum]|uniref:Bro-N domain-containing protein n=1 Tax=Sorangium cellulosum TaxID=56 RepID=A0A150P8B1_SORCE|nr:hypothetical protein BE04_18835 [Sorangium cellulosum]
MTDGSKGGGSVAMAVVTTVFEERDLTTYLFRGRPCMVAADVGRALGYADDGKALVEVMKKHWADELLPGKDMEVLSGYELREFKALLKDTDEKSASFSARVTVLYESGFDLVCVKTEKPLGKKLRRHLADEVMPKLRRGEAVGALPADRDASLRVRRAELFIRIAELLPPGICEEQRVANLVHASAELSGQRPSLPEARERWRRTAAIASDLGVTMPVVSKAASALGLRERPDMCRMVEDLRSHGNGMCQCPEYTDAAVEEIRAWIAANPRQGRKRAA